MSAITSAGSSGAASILTASNGPLAGLSSQMQSILEAASPADQVTLSTAALRLNEADGLFGGTSTDYSTQLVDPTESLLSTMYGLTQPSSTPAITDPTQSLIASGYGLSSTVQSPTDSTIGSLLNTIG